MPSTLIEVKQAVERIQETCLAVLNCLDDPRKRNDQVLRRVLVVGLENATEDFKLLLGELERGASTPVATRSVLEWPDGRHPDRRTSVRRVSDQQ